MDELNQQPSLGPPPEPAPAPQPDPAPVQADEPQPLPPDQPQEQAQQPPADEPLSNEQLAQIAGVDLKPQPESMSNEELAKIAGVELKPQEAPARSARDVRGEIESIDRITDPNVSNSGSWFDRANRAIFGVGSNDELAARKDNLSKQLPGLERQEKANLEKYLPKLKAASERIAQEEPESNLHYAARSTVNLFHGPATAFVYGQAKKRMADGKATYADIEDVARYEAMQKSDREASLGKSIGGMLLAAPGQLTGLAIGGIGAEATGLTGAARLGAQTVLTPGLYAERAIAANTEAGRSPLDVASLPAALLKAGAEMGMYAVAGKAAETFLPKSWTDTVVKRLVGQGLSMPVAQQAADLVNHAAGLEKGYGVLEDIANAKYGEALKHVTKDVVMGVVFTGAHELMRSGVPINESVKSVEDGWDAENLRRAQEPSPGDVRAGQTEGNDQSARSRAAQAFEDSGGFAGQEPAANRQPVAAGEPTATGRADATESGNPQAPVAPAGAEAVTVDTSPHADELQAAKQEAVDAKITPEEVKQSEKSGTDEGAERSRAVDNSTVERRFNDRYAKRYGADGVAKRLADYRELVSRDTALNTREQQRLERYTDVAYDLGRKEGSLRDRANALGLSQEGVRQRDLKAGITPEAATPDLSRVELRTRESSPSAADEAIANEQSNYYRLPGSGKTPSGPKPPANTQAVVTPPTPPAPRYPSGSLRYRNAERQARMDRDATAMEDMTRYFQKYIEADKDQFNREKKFLVFFGNSEKGMPQNIPADQQGFERAYRSIKDQYTSALASKGIIQDVIDDHISHLWKDPKNPNATVSQIMAKFSGRRPLAGKEAFTKERTLQYFEDGFSAGLEPITWNPGDYAKKEFDQYSRSIMAHDAREDYKAAGLRKYVSLGGKQPDGWTTPKDKGDTVFSPPSVNIKEYVDKQQMKGLEDFANSLGIPIDTKMTGPPGKYDPNGIVRKFATPESVLAHEIGHGIEDKFRLQQFARNPLIRGELSALADLRASGQVSAKYQQYLREPTEMFANLVAGYLHAPELTKQTAPNAYAALDSIIQGNPRLRALADIKPSLEIEEREQAKRLAGPMLTGHYYYPAEITKLIDNHVSPGLSSAPGLGGAAFRAFRGVGNQLSQFILGTSGFHATMTTMNAQASMLAEMAQRGLTGEGKAALRKAPESVVPLLAVEEAIRHHRFLKAEWDKPGSQGPDIAQEVQWLKEMGGRVRGGSDYTGDQLSQFRRTLRMIGAGDYGKIPEALARALPAINQLTAKPTMDMLVPAVKTKVAMDAMRQEMARRPNMTMAERQEVGGKIWDQVDDRFGLLTYDNLFLPRTMRDVLQTAFLSFGWNLGDVRGIGGGIADAAKPSMYKGLLAGEGASRKTGFLVSMMAMTGLYGSLYQLGMTGKLPDDPRDLWFPKTGNKNRDGTDERMQIPSYMKDMAGVTNRAGDSPLQIPQNAYSMTKHKLSPLLGLLGGILENRDWQNSMIANPNDKWTKQAKDYAMHILSAFEPISVSSAMRANEQGRGVGQQAQGFFGIQPAPSYITHTNEQQRAMEQNRHIEPTPLQRYLKKHR